MGLERRGTPVSVRPDRESFIAPQGVMRPPISVDTFMHTDMLKRADRQCRFLAPQLNQLQEHWTTTMQTAMGLMHGMDGPGMMGGPKMGQGMMGWGRMSDYYGKLTPEQLKQRQYMTDQRLRMHQMMMDQMMQRHYWMGQPQPEPKGK